MALLINDDCTACDACKPVCPNEAIAVGSPIYLIDALRCTDQSGVDDRGIPVLLGDFLALVDQALHSLAGD